MEKPIGFNQLIKKYRKENNLTQVELAKEIRRNQTTVSNYEKGIHFPNNAEEIKAIAQLLNEPVSYIIDAIEYSRNGVIKEHKVLLINLDRLDNDDLNKKYKFLIQGEEITNDELQKIIKLVKFERFNKEN